VLNNSIKIKSIILVVIGIAVSLLSNCSAYIFSDIVLDNKMCVCVYNLVSSTDLTWY